MADACGWAPHLQANDVAHVVGEAALQPPVKHPVAADAIDVRVAWGGGRINAGKERGEHGLGGGRRRGGRGEFDGDGSGAAFEHVDADTYDLEAVEERADVMRRGKREVEAACDAAPGSRTS